MTTNLIKKSITLGNVKENMNILASSSKIALKFVCVGSAPNFMDSPKGNTGINRCLEEIESASKLRKPWSNPVQRATLNEKPPSQLTMTVCINIYIFSRPCRGSTVVTLPWPAGTASTSSRYAVYPRSFVHFGLWWTYYENWKTSRFVFQTLPVKVIL